MWIERRGKKSVRGVESLVCSAMVDKRLANEAYYHGLLPREDIKALLRLNGDFLVRTTEPVAGKERAFVLSVMFKEEKEDGGIKHFVIKKLTTGKYIIERYGFNTVTAMIEHHRNSGESISKVGGKRGRVAA